MKTPQTDSEVRSWTLAHVLPMAVFVGCSLLLQVVGVWLTWKHPDAPWWRQAPEQWMYPLQSVLVAGILLRYRSYYDFRWSWGKTALGAVFGVVGIAIWLLPTAMYDRMGLSRDPGGWLGFLGVMARKEGFDPGIFESPVAWWVAVVMRFFRAAVVVALAEEIFWRGFLMRFVLNWEGAWWKQPFGKASWLSYGVVTGMFIAAHGAPDRPAAWVYGSLTYLLCVWTRSLGACVAMHFTANLLMCSFIMAYGKNGLW